MRGLLLIFCYNPRFGWTEKVFAALNDRYAPQIVRIVLVMVEIFATITRISVPTLSNIIILENV
jgi:hypothetical protein